MFDLEKKSYSSFALASSASTGVIHKGPPDSIGGSVIKASPKDEAHRRCRADPVRMLRGGKVAHEVLMSLLQSRHAYSQGLPVITGIAGAEVYSIYMHNSPDEGFDLSGRFSLAPQH